MKQFAFHRPFNKEKGYLIIYVPTKNNNPIIYNIILLWDEFKNHLADKTMHKTSITVRLCPS